MCISLLVLLKMNNNYGNFVRFVREKKVFDYYFDYFYMLHSTLLKSEKNILILALKEDFQILLDRSYVFKGSNDAVSCQVIQVRIEAYLGQNISISVNYTFLNHAIFNVITQAVDSNSKVLVSIYLAFLLVELTVL